MFLAYDSHQILNQPSSFAKVKPYKTPKVSANSGLSEWKGIAQIFNISPQWSLVTMPIMLSPVLIVTSVLILIYCGGGLHHNNLLEMDNCLAEQFLTIDALASLNLMFSPTIVLSKENILLSNKLLSLIFQRWFRMIEEYRKKLSLSLVWTGRAPAGLDNKVNFSSKE